MSSPPRGNAVECCWPGRGDPGCTEFVKLAKTITRYRPLIHNTLEIGLGNARSEATNTHLRLLARRAYGYYSAEALIAMAEPHRGVDSAHHYPDDHENPPTKASGNPIAGEPDGMARLGTVVDA
jgi:Transposase